MRWLSILVLVACGDNAIPHDPFEARSGSRIELRIFAYSDGTRQWDPTTFFDRDRNERCTVQRWSDGYTYCTPNAVPTVYTDPACKDEVGRWLATQPAPTYFFREHTLFGSEVVSKLLRRSDGIDPPATTYEITNGRCVETLPNGWNYFALGEAIEHTAFARMKHVVDENIVPRLGLDSYTTDDGLYVPVETDRPMLRDRLLDDDCKVADQPNSATTSCEPAYAGEAAFSRDAFCTNRDLLVIEAVTTVPEVVVTKTDGCRTFARRGVEIPNQTVFLDLGEACVPVNPPADAHLFEVGVAFEVPQLMRKHEPSEHRLQRILVTDGVTTVVDPLLFDSELGVDCVRTFVGQGYRCLPANTFATVLPYFADPACLEPIEISLVETGPCDSATRFAIDYRGPEPRVRPLVAPFQTTLYEISTADTCLPYIPPTRQKPFTVGEAMPPSAFVDAQLVIE